MKQYKYRICSLALLTALMATTHGAQAQDSMWSKDKWDVSVGAGVSYSPKYEGSDNMEVGVMPHLSVEWNELIFLSPGDGLGVHAYKGENLNVSTSVGYEEGRKESDDRKNLNGLGDIDAAAKLNLNVEYEIGPVTPYVEIEKHLGGADGLQVETGVQAMVPVSALTGGRWGGGHGAAGHGDDDEMNGPALSFGVGTQWVDDNYAEGYFGVSSAQSTRSGLARYTAESGFKSVDAEIGFLYPVNDKWSVMTSVEYSRLIGDAADSPIVKKENQFSGGMFLQYSF